MRMEESSAPVAMIPGSTGDAFMLLTVFILLDCSHAITYGRNYSPMSIQHLHIQVNPKSSSAVLHHIVCYLHEFSSCYIENLDLCIWASNA